MRHIISCWNTTSTTSRYVDRFAGSGITVSVAVIALPFPEQAAGCVSLRLLLFLHRGEVNPDNAQDGHKARALFEAFTSIIDEKLAEVSQQRSTGTHPPGEVVLEPHSLALLWPVFSILLTAGGVLHLF